MPLSLLLGASWSFGAAALSRVSWPGLLPYEIASLRLTAGLGVTAMLLSGLALLGFSAFSPYILLGACALLLRTRPLPLQLPAPDGVRWLALAAAVACLGSIAPVTDDDSLAYVIPIVNRIAATGSVEVWTDQARSMWPQSQQVLLAFLVQLGGDRLGALNAVQWLLAFGVVSALARRACASATHVAPALVIALGAPVVAFQISCAKEDLFLLAASAAAVLCLFDLESDAKVAVAGLFAGIAAGVKYPGAVVALAAGLWVLLARKDSRYRAALLFTGAAALAGGLWYALNLWRYGNPVAPLIFGARGTYQTAQLARQFVEGYGGPRTAFHFAFAPIHIFLEPGLFCGRGNLYNPAAYFGLAALFTAASRRRHAPLLFVAATFYTGWFFGLQNARLLLPAAVFLSPSAADFLVPLLHRRRWLRPLAAVAVLLSFGIVDAVGVLRAKRYLEDPVTFLERETQNYSDLQWMNANLDPTRHRVASDHKVLNYLRIPSLLLDPSYQIEISSAELDNPQSLLPALRRQRITHLFVSADSYSDLQPYLRRIHENPSSRLGGTRFFREPLSESTAVFEILYPNP